MRKFRSHLRSLLAFAMLSLFISCNGCENPSGDCDPGDLACICEQNPVAQGCPADCDRFPTFFAECSDCTTHPPGPNGNPPRCCAFPANANNPVCSGGPGDCPNFDPNDPDCNPNPDGGGIGDTGNGCSPFGEDFCGPEDCQATNSCQGFDDDCDGQADNNCGCIPGEFATLECYTGPAGTRGVGACADGVAQCNAVDINGNPVWGQCEGQLLPFPEDCNDEEDNDCDGLVNDGCSNLIVQCDAIANNSGVCEDGSTVCTNDTQCAGIGTGFCDTFDEEAFQAPLQQALLFATAIPSGAGATINSRTWAVTQRPVGSTTVPNPSNQFSSSMFLDVAGDFVVSFTATDTFGASATCSVTIHANPTENLRIELSWNTDDSDVDSHLLHPTAPTWYHSTLDCDYLNCNSSFGESPAWGSAGTGDDPRLDLDDVNGFGPENINIDNPEINTALGYRFGAYMFSDHGAGPTDTTVRIFCGGVVKAQFTHLDLTGSSSNSPPNQLWKVADIIFTSGTTCNVIPIDVITTMGGGGVPR